MNDPAAYHLATKTLAEDFAAWFEISGIDRLSLVGWRAHPAALTRVIPPLLLCAAVADQPVDPGVAGVVSRFVEAATVTDETSETVLV